MERLTLNVPFVYKATATQGRERNPREVMFGAFTEVDLILAEDAEAPVAVRYLKCDRIQGNEIDKDDPYQVELRIVGDQFYSRLSSREPTTLDFLTDLTPSTINQNPLVKASSNHTLAAYRMAFPDFGRRLPMSEEGYRIVSSSRAEDVEHIEDIARSYLIINGEVWRKSQYPVLKLEHSESWPWKSATISLERVDPHAKTSGHYINNYYRLDQLALIQAAAEEYLHDHDPAKRYISEKVSDVEILIPEALWFNPDIGDFLAFGEYVLKDGEKELLRQGRDVTNAWHDVQDAVIALSRNGGDVELDQLMQKIETLVQFKKRKEYPNTTLIEWFEQMQNRVANRPVGAERAPFKL